MFIDLVVCGPDMSGTSFQVGLLTDHLREKGLKIKDLRGTEAEALFLTKQFEYLNKNHESLTEFLKDSFVKPQDKIKVQENIIDNLIRNKYATMMIDYREDNYINPNDADVWIMEEPTNRSSGQDIRFVLNKASQFGIKTNPISEAYAHQVYRITEFLRFRMHMRNNGKIIIRSRSEESAAYQIYDENYLNNGIDNEEYINLPGHKIAFGAPPTHLFIAHASKDWTRDEYVNLKEQRSGGRELDDLELEVERQLLVNKRYATKWMENLYIEGTNMYGGKMPKFSRFNLYLSKEEIKKAMTSEMDKILSPKAL